MATRGGARTLGLEAEIGSIEPGKRADLIVVDRDRPAPAAGSRSVVDAGVRRARPDVRMTMVDGEVLVDDFQLTRDDEPGIVAAARVAAAELASRAGLS